MTVTSVPSLEERLSVLEYFLENWMGPTTSQSDDVLVIAIEYKG